VSILFLRILLIFVSSTCASRVPIIGLLVLRVISKIIWVSLEFLIEAAIIECSSGLIPIGWFLLNCIVFVVAVSSLAFGVAGVALLAPWGAGILLLILSARSMLMRLIRSVVYLVQRISVLLGLNGWILLFGILLRVSGIVAVVWLIFAFIPFIRFFLFAVWVLEFKVSLKRFSDLQNLIKCWLIDIHD
jgi:hypothetical protein